MGGAVSSGRDNNELIDNLMSGNYIRTLDVEKVFRALDRAEYMTPEARDQAYKDLAWRNGPLHLSSPCIYSEVMEGLELKPGLSFLNIGSGTGYLSTLAGLILGSPGINHGVEVHPAVVDYAVKKIRLFFENSPILDDFDFCEPKFYQGNGLCISPLAAGYDRVYCGAGCPVEYENYLKGLLKVGGILVMPLKDTLVQVRRLDDDKWSTRSLLSVSFASLRVPTAKEAANPLTLDQLTPVKLQMLARGVIRVAMRGGVTRRNPVLREKPRPAPPAACPRRICIPIEAGDAVEGLDVLHDLDPENGANEMNALLSLVVSMGQNRVAGALRFDHVQTDTDDDDADEGDEADEADGADGGDEAEAAEADEADDQPAPLPDYPLPGPGERLYNNGNRHGRYNPLLARLSTRHSPTIGPRSMPRRALDSLLQNIDFHDSDEEDRVSYQATLREHSIRRGNGNLRTAEGHLVDTDAINYVDIDELYDRSARNANMQFLRLGRYDNTDNLRPSNLNNTAGTTGNTNNTDAPSPGNSNNTNDPRPDNLNDVNSIGAGDTNTSDATRPGNGCNTDTDARPGASDNPDGNSKRRDGGSDHSKGCNRAVPEHDRVLSRNAILMSLYEPRDRPSTSAEKPLPAATATEDSAAAAGQATNSGPPRPELPGVPSEVEIDLAKMSEASASTSTTTMEWEETSAENVASEDDAEASISKPKRQKLDSGIGENTPSGSSPKTKTENSDTESQRPSEPTEAISDSATEHDRLSSSFDEDNRLHDDSDSMSTIESDSDTVDTEDFLNGYARSRSPSYWEPSPEELAHAARMQRRLARGGDARRVRLSVLMKRAVRELPLPYALKKFVNLGRCFEF